eukprot:COSAG02_NODE_23427_length_719_cov_0.951613_2_plen_126_part_00
MAAPSAALYVAHVMLMKLPVAQTSIPCRRHPVLVQVDHLVAPLPYAHVAAVLVVALTPQPALEVTRAQEEAQVHGADLLLVVALAAAHSLRLHATAAAALAVVRSLRLHATAAAALVAVHVQQLC